MGKPEKARRTTHTHHNVHVSGVHPELLAHAATARAQRANGVRLVEVEVRLRCSKGSGVRRQRMAGAMEPTGGSIQPME